MATLKTKIKIRRDTAANLANIKLELGEPGYATDTKKLAIGDGTNIFSNLIDYGSVNGNYAKYEKLTMRDSSGEVNDSVTGLRLLYNDDTAPLYFVAPNAGIMPREEDELCILGAKFNPFYQANVKELRLRSTEANTSDITFGREGWNFIRCSANNASNAIAFMPGYNATVSPNNASFSIHPNYIAPGKKKGTVDIGTSTYGFKNLYIGNLTAATSSSGKISWSSEDVNYAYISGTTASQLGFGIQGATALILQYNNSSKYFGPNTTHKNAIDLGRSNAMFRNLYISGDISDGAYTYTLPDKTGTIALTSDLHPVYVTDLR